MIEGWLKEVAETAAITIETLEKKSQDLGTITYADERVQSLCMGYLYLLNLCDTYELLERRDLETLTDLIKKHTTIH